MLYNAKQLAPVVLAFTLSLGVAWTSWAAPSTAVGTVVSDPKFTTYDGRIYDFREARAVSDQVDA